MEDLRTQGPDVDVHDDVMGGDQQDVQQDVDMQDGGSLIDWRASLPEDLREHPAVQKFKTPADLFKSYVELESLLGKKKIPLPESEDDPAWEQVWKSLGVPESEEGYQVDIPEGVEVREEVLNEFKSVAKDLKLLPQQADKLARWWIEKESEILAEQERVAEERVKEAEKSLRKEWGQAFESKLLLARKAVEAVGGEDLLERLEETGLGNAPVVIKAFARIGEMLSEDTLKGFRPGWYAMTPEEAREQIRKIMNDTKGPYWDEFHPEHEAVVKKVLELRKIAGGGQ